MALGNIFKKKPEEVRAEKKKRVEKTVKVKEKPKVEKKEKRKDLSPVYRILKSAHVSEKAADLAEGNQYVFKVYPRSNKAEVRNAIESLFSVDVAAVRIINVPSRKRRLGRIVGERSGYKKAIIKLKAGQSIEVLPR